MIYLKKQNNNESGFTILESIISIFILLTAITGPLAYVTSGFKAARQAENQMIAYYLAVETIEEIKFYRDNNRVSGWESLGFVPAVVNSGNDQFDWDSSTSSFLGCASNGTGQGHDCGKLYIKDTTGSYGYATGAGYTESIFTRDVIEYTRDSNNPDEYIITIRTSWEDLNRTYDVEVTEHIFDVHTF